MSQLKCERCHKEFKSKGGYIGHKKKLKPCKEKIKIEDESIKNVTTPKMNDTKEATSNKYENNFNIENNKAGKVDNEKPKDNKFIGSVNNEINENLSHPAKDKYQQQTKSQDELINKNNKGGENDYIHDIDSSKDSDTDKYIETFELRAYGDENLDYITDEDYVRIFNMGDNSLTYYIEMIHFHSEHPENHNIYIEDMDDKMIHMYNGIMWITAPIERVIEKLYESRTQEFKEKILDILRPKKYYLSGKRYSEMP